MVRKGQEVLLQTPARSRKPAFAIRLPGMLLAAVLISPEVFAAQSMKIDSSVPIYVHADESESVMLAVRDLQRDLQNVLDRAPRIVRKLPDTGPATGHQDWPDGQFCTCGLNRVGRRTVSTRTTIACF